MALREPAVADRPHVAALLRALIRHDTTNPPGNERECAAYCREILNGVGIPADLLGNDPNRVNDPQHIVRLSGMVTSVSWDIVAGLPELGIGVEEERAAGLEVA